MAQVAILFKVTVKQSQTCRSPARFLVTPLFFPLTARRFLSWILCAFRNRPLIIRHFFPTSHSAHQQMSQFLISRSTHNRRLSRTQVLLILAVLIFPCVLPLVMPQAMASRAPACLPAGAHLLRPSFAICLYVSPSSSQSSPTASQAFRRSSANSTISQIERRNGCTLGKRDPPTSTRPRVLASKHGRLAVSSVFPVETKSVVSAWPLPKIAGSASSSSQRRTSRSHTLRESEGDSQPPGKRQPSFSPAQKAPEEWYQQDESSFAVLFLSDSPVVRTRTLSRKFVLFPSLMLIQIPTGSSAIMAAIMPALCFDPKRHVNNSLQPMPVRKSSRPLTTRWECASPLMFLFAKHAPSMNARRRSVWPPL